MKPKRKNTPATPQKRVEHEKEKKPLLLPVAVVFFLSVWAWATLYYGPVFRIAREFSFWAPDGTLMYFIKGRPWSAVCWGGRALLQLYHWPVVGGALTALFVSGSSWLIGYCLRLRGWWRLLQYIPAAVYLWVTAYIGFDLYYETETGMIMGIPFVCFFVLSVLALIIRSFSRHHTFPNIIRPPKDEQPLLNRIQTLAVLGIVIIAVGITHVMRPYVRVVAKMQCQMMEQDWGGMAKTARDNAELSYRQLSAYYTMALVQRGEQCSRLFDIRMDYDEPYIHGFEGQESNGEKYYIMECDLYAGLVQTAIHHAIENMTMNGPSIRTLKILTKCALLRGEWSVAEKYLGILQHVPFEEAFVKRYKPMLGNVALVDADPEFKMIRLTEPLRDNFENFLTQPVFLGYNATLMEGRSVNALYNSLAVHIYTKSMPQFMERVAPLAGSTPPANVSDAVLLMSSKYPQALKLFPNIEYNRQQLMLFMQSVRPYIKSFEARTGHARELFPKWKGYYPYYYFFGNLKATKRKDATNEESSKHGVN